MEKDRAALLALKAKLEMKLELMSTDDRAWRAPGPLSVSALALRRAADRVNADLPRERDPDRVSELRILKMRLESLQGVYRLSEAYAAKSAPPGVTIH